MEWSLENTTQRRANRVSYATALEVNPDPPQYMGGDMFQESYKLSATIACTFWANRVQLDRARERAEKQLQYYLYKDAIHILHDMELAVEEMDQDQLHRACLDMRELFTRT